MNIQIFGTKKCNDTKKAERYFKERRIKYAFIDMKEKGISKGELTSVKNSVKLNNLINEKAKSYKNSNLDKIRSEETKMEVMLKDCTLIKTPIVRNGKLATVGYEPEVWKEWE
ncbi:arsenate reductase family protein [Clostridium chrysemydis]|uniref:arsenate reductase family protein n=1 Tax=Clostridium chrysemydis TaxID=2665504 RepID=UPI00188368F3|nr:arsenate reductase family protein [Clostridium chrysemydis]